MRYFIGFAAILCVIAGCSTTKSVQQDTQVKEPVKEEFAVPSWYNEGVRSTSDSLEINGYALSSAIDSLRAVELSSQTAIKNLRFEIDQIAEKIRINLVTADDEFSGNYSTPGFIIQLRNTVSNLPLDTATIIYKHELSERGIYYSYAKATFLRTELVNLFSEYVVDESFIQEFRADS